MDQELINEILQGGETLQDEINRPFRPLVETDYPYNHFTPAYLLGFGDKGSGKSLSALSVPRNILAITFEKRGNLTRPWAQYFNYDPRMQIYGVAEYIDRSTTEAYRNSSNKVYMAVVELMKRAIDYGFDWVILDGIQSGHKVSEQRMRAINGIKAFDKFNNLSIWGERTMYLENIAITLAGHVATKGVYITSQNVLQKAMFLTEAQEKAGMKEEDIPVKEPKWKDAIKEDVDTVIYHEIREEMLGGGRSRMKYIATVSSNKLSGFTGSADLTLSEDNTTATFDFIDSLLTKDVGFVLTR